MRPRRVLLLVLASIIAVIGFGVLAAGASLGWAHGTQRDDAGFFTTSNERFETDSFALSSDEIDLGQPGRDDWWADRDLATVRITVDNADARQRSSASVLNPKWRPISPAFHTTTSPTWTFIDRRSTTAARTLTGPPRQHLLPIRHSGLPRYQARPAKASRGTSSPATGRSW